MRIIIKQGESIQEVDVASFSLENRQRLFNLLDLSSFSDEVFAEFEDRPRFRKIRLSDALLACPYGAWFHVCFSTKLEGEAEEVPDHPGFIAQLRTHKASGFCKRCNKQHTLKEQSVLVSTEVEGLKFSRGYRYDV